MTLASAIYAGRVTHARHKPRPHRLTYRIFMLLLDLDELDGLHRRLRWFAHDRFALTAFHEADHGDGSRRPLRAQVDRLLEDAGLPCGGPVRVLCMPRILGAAFNPLTVYFCHSRDGALGAILYEVNNTFGERHSYLIPAEDNDVVRQACDKVFYVSPFLDMDLAYAFRVRPPGEALDVTIRVADAEGAVLDAGFSARRVEMTDAALLRAWASHPLMTLGALWAIHWEAAKIWLKGERLRPRPAPPRQPVTVTPCARAAA